MSGHSRWAQIKHKKSLTDSKKSKLFSKLLKSITAAAKNDPNPEFNPRLRSAVAAAKNIGVPNDNIEKAVKKSSDSSEKLEDLVAEAYGPGGIAIIIKSITDSKNRTVMEIKNILKDHNSKLVPPGSVLWAFDSVTENNEISWTPKFIQEISEQEKNELEKLLTGLEDLDDVQDIFCNTNL